MGKSDEELLVEATALVKKAFSEVLSLEEDAVKDETDFFEVGGSELLLLRFLYRLFGVHPDFFAPYLSATYRLGAGQDSD